MIDFQAQPLPLNFAVLAVACLALLPLSSTVSRTPGGTR